MIQQQQVNTAEGILKINKYNDTNHDLGNQANTVNQTINGIDLLRAAKGFSYNCYECFEKMFPDNYVDEKRQYDNSVAKNAVLKKYDNNNHVVNQPSNDVSNRARIPKYEEMYNDSICSFFIGSISVISLYVVFQMIDKN
jgi:hypothetical protein